MTGLKTSAFAFAPVFAVVVFGDFAMPFAFALSALALVFDLSSFLRVPLPEPLPDLVVASSDLSSSSSSSATACPCKEFRNRFACSCGDSVGLCVVNGDDNGIFVDCSVGVSGGDICGASSIALGPSMDAEDDERPRTPLIGGGRVISMLASLWLVCCWFCCIIFIIIIHIACMGLPMSDAGGGFDCAGWCRTIASVLCLRATASPRHQMFRSISRSKSRSTANGVWLSPSNMIENLGCGNIVGDSG